MADKPPVKLDVPAYNPVTQDLSYVAESDVPALRAAGILTGGDAEAAHGRSGVGGAIGTFLAGAPAAASGGFSDNALPAITRSLGHTAQHFLGFNDKDLSSNEAFQAALRDSREQHGIADFLGRMAGVGSVLSPVGEAAEGTAGVLRLAGIADKAALVGKAGAAARVGTSALLGGLEALHARQDSQLDTPLAASAIMQGAVTGGLFGLGGEVAGGVLGRLATKAQRGAAKWLDEAALSGEFRGVKGTEKTFDQIYPGKSPEVKDYYTNQFRKAGMEPRDIEDIRFARRLYPHEAANINDGDTARTFLKQEDMASAGIGTPRARPRPEDGLTPLQSGELPGILTPDEIENYLPKLRAAGEGHLNEAADAFENARDAEAARQARMAPYLEAHGKAAEEAAAQLDPTASRYNARLAESRGTFLADAQRTVAEKNKLSFLQGQADALGRDVEGQAFRYNRAKGAAPSVEGTPADATGATSATPTVDPRAPLDADLEQQIFDHYQKEIETPIPGEAERQIRGTGKDIDFHPEYVHAPVFDADQHTLTFPNTPDEKAQARLVLRFKGKDGELYPPLKRIPSHPENIATARRASQETGVPLPHQDIYRKQWTDEEKVFRRYNEAENKFKISMHPIWENGMLEQGRNITDPVEAEAAIKAGTHIRVKKSGNVIPDYPENMRIIENERATYRGDNPAAPVTKAEARAVKAAQEATARAAAEAPLPPSLSRLSKDTLKKLAARPADAKAPPIPPELDALLQRHAAGQAPIEGLPDVPEFGDAPADPHFAPFQAPQPDLFGGVVPGARAYNKYTMRRPHVVTGVTIAHWLGKVPDIPIAPGVHIPLGKILQGGKIVSVASQLARRTGTEFALNHEVFVNGVLQKAVAPMMKSLAFAIKNGLEAEGNRQAAKGIDELNVPVASTDPAFEAVREGTTRLAASPDALQQAVDGRVGHIVAERPILGQHLQSAAAQQVAYLASQLPQPTAQSGALDGNSPDFPRSVKRQFLEKYMGVINPVACFQAPTVNNMSAVAATHPDLLQYYRQEITAKLSDPTIAARVMANPEMRRRLSIVMGVPMSRSETPQVLASLQQSAQAATAVGAQPGPGAPGMAKPPQGSTVNITGKQADNFAGAGALPQQQDQLDNLGAG